MMCPLLAIAATLDTSGNSPYECHKEKCAWWVKIWYNEVQNVWIYGCAIGKLGEK